MPNTSKDRYGMTLSTSSPTAAERLQEGRDRLLSQNEGPETQFHEAIALDEAFAVAHGYLAFWYMQRARPEEARASAKHALSLAPGITRRERQQLEAISFWINGAASQALARLKEHLSEFPRDALLMRLAHRLYALGCSGAGVANFPPEFLALLQGVAPHCREDWAFLGEYAWAHHETGFLDESMRLAQRSLELNPTNAVATHSVTHVYFERGNASDGRDFLDNWLQGFDCPATSYVHLSWHLALFELALGRYQEALELYENGVRPSVVAKSLVTLSDSASLLWRLQLYGGTPPPKPWQEVRDLAAPAAEKSGAAFRDAHAALAFAASGDQDAIGKMMHRWRSAAEQGNLFAKEVVLPLVQGIHAFAQGNYADAAHLLEPVFPQMVRIGGSHAQREVFEDTLLEAYLRAEQFDKAEDMLDTRLKRRGSVRDTFWLGRVQAGQGQGEQAQTSFEAATQGWQEGDAASPEMTNLNRLAAAVH